MYRILGFMFGLLLLSGCTDIGYSHSEYEKKLGDWIGKSEKSLYAAWGMPVRITPVGADTILLTYYSSESQPIDNVFQPYESEMSYAAMTVPNYGLPPAPPLYYCKTDFVVRNGIVTGYNFNGDDCY